MKNALLTKFLLILASLVLLGAAAGCGTADEQTDEQQQEEQQTEESGEKASESVDHPEVEENPSVTITMENNKEIVLELFPNKAPNTVANFVSLVEEGYYDGLIFHRVIPEFMIQGGDPEGTGTGGPGYTIPGEFTSNGFENNITHERGVISMARSGDPDSAGSQFFIMVADSPHLDGEYAAFGKVIEGIDVVDEIVAAERDAADKPLEDQKMKTVTVDTKGHDYLEPEKIK